MRRSRPSVVLAQAIALSAITSFTWIVGCTSVKFGMSPRISAPCAARPRSSAACESKVSSAVTR
jgi:hypothetical protein